LIRRNQILVVHKGTEAGDCPELKVSMNKAPCHPEGWAPAPFWDGSCRVLFCSDFRIVGVQVVLPLNGIMILVEIVGAAMMQAALTLHDFELIPVYIMAGWTTIRIIRAHRTLPI